MIPRKYIPLGCTFRDRLEGFLTFLLFCFNEIFSILPIKFTYAKYIDDTTFLFHLPVHRTNLKVRKHIAPWRLFLFILHSNLTFTKTRSEVKVSNWSVDYLKTTSMQFLRCGLRIWVALPLRRASHILTSCNLLTVRRISLLYPVILRSARILTIPGYTPKKQRCLPEV